MFPVDGLAGAVAIEGDGPRGRSRARGRQLAVTTFTALGLAMFSGVQGTLSVVTSGRCGVANGAR
jgi:hypothetical protein